MDRLKVTQLIEMIASSFTKLYIDLETLAATPHKADKTNALRDMEKLGAEYKKTLRESGIDLRKFEVLPEFDQLNHLCNLAPHQATASLEELTSWYRKIIYTLEKIDQKYGTGQSTLKKAA